MQLGPNSGDNSNFQFLMSQYQDAGNPIKVQFNNYGYALGKAKHPTIHGTNPSAFGNQNMFQVNSKLLSKGCTSRAGSYFTY